MGVFTADELREGWERYQAVTARACETGEWGPWADVFTEDATYKEHAYGEFEGREAIREWIIDVMAPYPTMTFPVDWVTLDHAQGFIVFQCQNAFPAPFDDDGQPFGFPSWTRLDYAGDGLFSREEDIYNPALGAPCFKAWYDAGGRPVDKVRVGMQHG